MNDLRSAILAKLAEPIDVLNKLQVEQEETYRVPPLQFWQQTASLAQEQAREVKKFVDHYPDKGELCPAVMPDVISPVMNHLSKVYEHAERLIIIFSKNRIKN